MDEALLEPLAVIGMAGHFPKAKNLEEFWYNISNGIECITYFSDEEALATGLDPELLKNSKFVKAHGILENPEYFDANFFDMSPREARILDPQHRIFLECAWEAVENAGYYPEKYQGRVGVYAGTSFSTYLFRNILPNNLINFPTIDRLEMALTNHKDTMPMRVSFHMNLKGPSICVGTTCSTSLVATHLGCQALWAYQCDMALVGASFLRVPATEGYLFQEGMIYSPDGHIKTFDADSKGIVTGAGVGVVIIKRLSEAISDGDNVIALILGTSLNNDGNTKIGYTAPSVDGQAEAIAEAISLSGVTSDTITYVETHGTGTELGDPVEVAAMIQAFKATSKDNENQKKHYCGIGSAKPNIGHLNHAAGIAGLIKAILSLEHKQLPPSINFKKPNPKIDFENSPFFVNTKLREWKTETDIPRRCGVNAFGIGGTNGHIVLEEAPDLTESSASRDYQLLMLSAKTSTALETMTDNLVNHLNKHPELKLADAAFTLQVGRKPFAYRRFCIAPNTKKAIESLTNRDAKCVFNNMQKMADKPVVFMFSGQGSQYANMTLGLYESEIVFKLEIDKCCEILKPNLNFDLRDLLYPQEKDVENANQKLQQTEITQPALFTIEYALAKLWQSFGIKPKAMLGHSIGEYVAACLSDVFSLEDGLSLVTARGKLIQSLPSGEMLAVFLSADELMPLLNENLSLSLINSSKMCVVGGISVAIQAFEQQLISKNIPCQRLYTSHAFHSSMMQPIVEPFIDLMQKVKLNPPKIPYLSNTTGDWIKVSEAVNPLYWAKHLRQTLRFSDDLQLVLQNGEYILLEVGPGRTLSTLARQHKAKKSEQIILTSVRHPHENISDAEFMLSTLGKLWLAGIEIDNKAFFANQKRQRVVLPTYPFERERYWIDAPKPQADGVKQPQRSLSRLGEFDAEKQDKPAQIDISSKNAPRNRKEQIIVETIKNVLAIGQVGIHDNFFDLGGNSLIASIVVLQICEKLKTNLSVKAFLSAATVAEAASLIKDEAVEIKSNTSDYLVNLKKGKEGIKPIFLIHAVDGFVFFYRELVQSLAINNPIYAIQSQGLMGEVQPLTTIKEMAAYYIQAIKIIQPKGSYILGGSSFGGAVAYEMAQQLKANKEEVSLLFMFDTPAVNSPFFNLEDNAEILIFISQYLLKLPKDIIKLSSLRELNAEEQIRYVLSEIKNAGLLTGIEFEQLKNWVAVFKANANAMQTYTPDTYEGKIMFFRPCERLVKNNKPLKSEHYWLELAKSIEIHTIEGNHVTMNFLPNVRLIAEKLKTIII